MESMTSIVPDPSIGAVLMGFDLNINYKKLAKAFTYLTSDPDCLFLATNDDASFPAGPRLYPGCGSLQAPLITAMLGRRPKVIGKPHQSMLDVVVNQ
jgi:4-nitrophenyl phosphatase